MGTIDKAGCPESVEDFRAEQVGELYHQAWAEWGNCLSTVRVTEAWQRLGSPDTGITFNFALSKAHTNIQTIR